MNTPPHAHPGDRFQLTDGRTVLVRAVQPTDAPLLREGFANLSVESRHRRFLGARKALSDAEIAYLCSPDGDKHVAIGAALLEDDREIPAGVARFIRLDDDPTTAEAAVTIVDDFQRLGLGKILLTRLVRAAREIGVERFEFTMLEGNDPMLRLVESLGATIQREDSVEIRARLPLPELPELPEPSATPLFRAMAMVASGVLSFAPFRRALERLEQMTR